MVFYAPDTPCDYDEEKILKYSPFIESIIKNGTVIVTGNVLNELFKIIEKNEYSLYLSINGFNEKDYGFKRYRENNQQRELVKHKLSLVYKQIKSIMTVAHSNSDSEKTAEGFISDFLVHRADYVDYSLVKFCESEGIQNLLTDDADYKTIHNSLNIYTANQKFFI